MTLHPGLASGRAQHASRLLQVLSWGSRPGTPFPCLLVLQRNKIKALACMPAGMA
jgi:hypothetical protein